MSIENALPVTPLSRAGSLPHGVLRCRKVEVHLKSLWERACSRWRQYIQHRCKQAHRYREQARSHWEFVVSTGLSGMCVGLRWVGLVPGPARFRSAPG
ncbi:hypothetical protein C0J56_13470 [Pseudomonas fluorescens]|nr:hypothetical protein C0J56_13470 [Pseudomonas fluorescens]